MGFKIIKSVGAIPCGCPAQWGPAERSPSTMKPMGFKIIKHVGAIPCGCPTQQDQHIIKFPTVQGNHKGLPLHDLGIAFKVIFIPSCQFT